MMAYERYESAWDNFLQIHIPTSTKNQNISQETWKDPNKVI